MTDTLENPHRGKGLPNLDLYPADSAAPVSALLAHCPAHATTPLVQRPAIAAQVGIDQLFVKDESGRMGLGSFKALGAAYALARDAANLKGDGPWETALSGRSYVTASAGNHGLSVAAGAKLFGAQAIICLAASVPEAFADRLRSKGAEVVRAGAIYEESMATAEKLAADNGWALLSDSSWPGYTDPPHAVMEGYLQLAEEAADQIDEVPTHIFLQAGVGGMAAALAAHARARWGDKPTIVVVEPEAAPALIESVRTGKVIDTTGPVSAMGRLDCKTPSMIALAGLARDADVFVTISEEEAAEAVSILSQENLASTPSGVAGIAAVLCKRPKLPSNARVLTYLSEGPEDG